MASGAIRLSAGAPAGLLVCDGADEGHKHHRLLADVKQETGACVYCSRAYGVKDQVDAAGIQALDEYKGHPSMRQLIVDGFDVITF